MKIKLLIVAFVVCFYCGNTQVTELSTLPAPVSNNAVTGALVDGDFHVYSFSGIDSTKVWSGIHKKAYRYNTQTDLWDTIPQLPSGTGRIAAGASTVKNKIYIIGGYEVFADGSERSLDEVHVYDPETNVYLPNGQPIPVPIDDHVQAVWKDSLIFVVTGWSQDMNVRDVQIYNPTEDIWLTGTTLPNITSYRVFGASGTIIGDTLYYAGGARFANDFPATTHFRKGYINPLDPTDITWSILPDSESTLYRGACGSHTDYGAVWFGGSTVTYNYNGIAYNGSGGVMPSGKIKHYYQTGGMKELPFPTFPLMMDYRGLAQNGNEYYFVGGMDDNQVVTDRAFSMSLILSNNDNIQASSVRVYPNPATDLINLEYDGRFDFTLVNILGQTMKVGKVESKSILSINDLDDGVYYLTMRNEQGLNHVEQIVKYSKY